MGNYCRICGGTRDNEKFSGKGHKNHICKNCSGKPSQNTKRNDSSETTFASKNMLPSNAVPVQSEEMLDDNWLYKIDFEKQNFDDELPF